MKFLEKEVSAVAEGRHYYVDESKTSFAKKNEYKIRGSVKTGALSTAKISYVGHHDHSSKRRKEPCFDG